MPKDVIVALDFPNREGTFAFLDRFKEFNEELPFVKVGMELFYAEGADMVREIARRGHRIFLDLKVCDIPNTARGAMASLANLPIDIVNLHALGGKDMMAAALEGLTREGGKRPLLIAVTILTSIDNRRLNGELGIVGDAGDAAERLAKLAKDAGLDGIVCSPQEAQRIHDVCGEQFLTVTPGVRFPDADKGDQQRVVSPDEARRIGSDYIVVGRPITKAADPVAAYRQYKQAFIGKGDN